MNTFLNLVGGDHNLKNQIRELKDQNEALHKENEVLKKFYFDSSETNTNRLFNKLLTDVKTAFFDDDKMKNDSMSQFKNFIIENSVFYYGLEEDEITELNEMKINDADWSKNKDIFLLKQRLIERNFRMLIENIKENEIMKELEKKTGIITEKNQNENSTSNKEKDYFSNNGKDFKNNSNNTTKEERINEDNNISNKSLEEGKNNSSSINNKKISDSKLTPQVNNSQADKKPFTLKQKQNKGNNNNDDILMSLVEDSLIKTIQPIQNTTNTNQNQVDKKESKRFLWDEEEEFN